MGRRVGYARVSTDGQSADGQVDALLREGIAREDIHVEVESTRRSLPVRDRLVSSLTAGDEILVWRLDRYGRGVVGMVTAIEQLRARGITLRSVTEGITTDDSTAMGRCMVTILLALGEMERETIRERTKLGVARARAQGRKPGRPVVDGDHPVMRHRIALAHKLREGGSTIAEIAHSISISPATVHRWLRLPAPDAPTE